MLLLKYYLKEKLIQLKSIIYLLECENPSDDISRKSRIAEEFLSLLLLLLYCFDLPLVK